MTGGRRRALVATSALGVSALIASVAHSTLGLGPDGLTWQLLFCVVYLCAGALCLARAAWVQAERAVWLCLGAGILLHGSGWLVDFVAYDGRAPMPSLSDPLWLGAYLGFYPGVVLLGRVRFARRGVGMWLDGLLGGLALGAVTAATALQASLSHLDAAGSAAVTGAAYPLADVALLTFLATMFAGSSWRPACRDWRSSPGCSSSPASTRPMRSTAPTTAGSPAAPTTRCGASRCSCSPLPPGCPRVTAR